MKLKTIGSKQDVHLIGRRCSARRMPAKFLWPLYTQAGYIFLCSLISDGYEHIQTTFSHALENSICVGGHIYVTIVQIFTLLHLQRRGFYQNPQFTTRTWNKSSAFRSSLGRSLNLFRSICHPLRKALLSPALNLRAGKVNSYASDETPFSPPKRSCHFRALCFQNHIALCSLIPV